MVVVSFEVARRHMQAEIQRALVASVAGGGSDDDSDDAKSEVVVMYSAPEPPPQVPHEQPLLLPAPRPTVAPEAEVQSPEPKPIHKARPTRTPPAAAQANLGGVSFGWWD